MHREAIDKALLAGESYRHIAAQSGTSTGALQRHREHLPKDLAKTHEAQQLVRAGTLMDGIHTAHGRAERLYASAEDILMRAMKVEDLRTALQAIRAAVDVMGEARGYLELEGEVTGALERPQTIMVVSGDAIQGTHGGKDEALDDAPERGTIDLSPEDFTQSG
jgi:hypothetical protein